MQAFTDAPIYARTNGYLKKRYVDIGARVQAGQLLAEIDTPELDQQLQQARADLATAEANARLAQTTAERYRDLIKSDSVSRQDLDNANGNLEARLAAVESARANVKRLEQLQAFSRIEAPFDGVITARNTDVGALIDSGSNAKELFHVAAMRQAARVRQRAAGLLARGAARADGRPDAEGIPRPPLHRHAGADRATRSTSPRARCSPRSTSTTRRASCCPGRTPKCTSSCRRPPPRCSCRWTR